MVRKLYDKFERRFLIGRGWFQPLFESLHRFSLRGMNYGQNDSIESSGELMVLKRIKKDILNDDPSIIFDVGANKGQYLNALLKYFSAGKIYCFEPAPFAFKKLEAIGSTMSNVKCFQFGFGAEKSNKNLRFKTEGSVLASINPFENDFNKSAEIEIRTIDDFCLEHGIDQIFFLKIDVEGYELEVLKGAKNFISGGKIKYIQFEMGKNSLKQGVYLYKFLEILSNYKIYRILKKNIKELSPYEVRHEIFLTTNYLGVLK